MPPRSC
ncbi:hypothetical protein LINGRAHAP2_LOCUS10162 [Linum grandiflorum]